MTLHLAAPAHHEPIDYAGAALLCLAIVLVILLCGGAAGRETPFLALAAAASVAGWLLTARRAADPIIPLGLFRDRSFAIPTAISFLIGFAMFATVSFLPAFLQVGLGLSATASGGVLLVLVVGLLSTMTASGLLITWTGRYKAYPVAGTALAVPAAWLFSTLDSRSGIWAVLAATLGLGLGMGLVMQVMVLLVQNSVGRRELGTATSTLTLLRQVGAAIGVAVLGSLITARFVAAVPVEVASALGQGLNSLTPQLLAGLPAEDRAAVQEAFGEALPPVFAYAAIVLAAAFVLALFLPQRELRTVAFADDDGGGAPVRQRSGSASAGPKRRRKGRHRAQPARGRARDAAPDGRTA